MTVDLREKVRPVLLGADLNAYGMALAFHSAYGLVSEAIGKYRSGPTAYSHIVDFRECPELGDSDRALALLSELSRSRPDKTMILVPCTDEYSEFVIRNREELSKYFLFTCPSETLMEALHSKAGFMKLCASAGIDIPQTHIFSGSPEPAQLSEDNTGIKYPAVLKPSVSAEYWKHPFAGMRKVFFPKDENECADICRRISESGYTGELLLQKTVMGGDCNMRVLTAFSDSSGRVRAAVLGHVLLEEHAPKARGNHAAIITEPLDETCIRLVRLLDSLGYQGFSNFDMKLDPEDGTVKVFEINLRQGRSNSYLTAAGINPAELLVRDILFSQPIGGEFDYPEVLWHSVPASVIRKYCQDKGAAHSAEVLLHRGRSFCPYRYAGDLNGNLKRRLYVFLHGLRQRKSFDKYFPRGTVFDTERVPAVRRVIKRSAEG